MTVQNLSSNLASRKTLASADMAMPYDQWGLRANTWTRPSDWLTLPTMTETSEKMVALVAVHPHDSNYFALTITCSSGTYSVNWGDGTSNANVTSGVQANKLYTYSAAALNGTESTRGYRQAIVQVTADNGANAMIGIDINKKHPQVGLQQHNNPILDLGIAGNAITTLQLSSNGNFVASDNAAGLDVKYMLTEQVNIYRLSNSITSLSRLFQQYRRLKSVPNFYVPTALNNFSYAFADTGIVTIPDWMTTNLSNVTNLSLMFTSSRALQSVPDMDLNGATNISSMFQGCESLIEVRLTKLRSVTNANNMFYQCYALQRVVLGDMPSNAGLNAVFYQNYALKYAYIGKTSNVTDFTNMFQTCRALKTAPMMDTSKATLMVSMFNNCNNLMYVPAYDTRNVTNFQGIFAQCRSLKNIPNFNTSKGTNFQSAFDNCSVLEQHPTWDFTNATNTYGLFTACWGLKSINIYIPNTTTTNRFASDCQSLETVTITDMGKSLDAQYMFQSAHSLRMANLSNTASVTNFDWAFSYNYGLAAAPELNTNNVTSMGAMFYECHGLRYVPLYNTANVTGFTSVFYNNYNLTAVPAFNTKNVTSIDQTFFQCQALKEIPASFDLANCLIFTNMFNGCVSLTKAPAIVMSKATDATGMFSSCNSLGDATGLSNVRSTISLNLCTMSANNLNRLYTNLPTRSGVTIDVTGNYGTTLDTPSIATSKGWTVTG